MKEKRLESLIDIAIDREIEACDFYKNLAGRVEDPTVRDTLDFLAGEERRHREFLERYRDGRYESGTLRLADVVDYKIAEYLEAPDIKKDMDSAEVYLVAAHRELQSYRFYRALADLHPDGEAKDMLLRIASEEMKHKEKVEYLYSNTAFPQTAGG
ncbi:MAG: ferritin family protein, partial [Deltaproteobacteria bacterium]|nr:ferritin family protein [Deltaproteobacteria bacterium]